jgi:hypothetical protein
MNSVFIRQYNNQLVIHIVTIDCKLLEELAGVEPRLYSSAPRGKL